MKAYLIVDIARQYDNKEVRIRRTTLAEVQLCLCARPSASVWLDRCHVRLHYGCRLLVGSGDPPSCSVREEIYNDLLA